MQIYKITNIVNGKIYVGKTTKTLNERFEKHVYSSKYNDTYLYRAIKKYGKNSFKIELLETIEDPKILDQREIYWIENLNTLNPIGYNMIPGGTGGDTSSSPNYKEGMNQRDFKGNKNPMYGKSRKGESRSDITKHNISQATQIAWDKNDHRKKEASERVLGIKNPMYGKIPKNSISIIFQNVEYPSITEACRQTKHSSGYIKKYATRS